MYKEEKSLFSIEFPALESDPAAPIIADGCDNNSNFFTEGAYRSTCCCGCHSPAR